MAFPFEKPGMNGSNPSGKPKLIVLGTGFAGFSLLKGIDKREYEVTVISPRNHFLFTPLLTSTTVGTIEFRSIIEPVRTIHEHIHYHQAFCTKIDPERRTIECKNALDGETFQLVFDSLVITVGAETATYGIPGVWEHALFLRDLSDARAIRQRINENFERAETPGISEESRRRLLHFVVVGGGPTGVEFAAELHDFFEKDLRKWFPQLVDKVSITLLEATPQLLSKFDATLREYALKVFQRQRIDVRLSTTVARVDQASVELGDGSTLLCGLVVWTAGVAPSEFIRSLPFEKTERHRIVVDNHLRVKGWTNIYAAGDCATLEAIDLPMTSQVAQQEGKYLARLLNNSTRGKQYKPFHYRHFGMLAYIGSNRALADLPTIKGKGFSTWLFWRSTYLTKLVSWKNKILVVFDWWKTLIFGRDISLF